ncbi:MAG: DUF5615 family PIN-like protein [Chloroflexota bacterium]
MTDENMPNVVSEQLAKKDVDVVRLIDVLPSGTKDPKVLEYCYNENYALVTFDENIREHINDRALEHKEHAGIFIGAGLQNPNGIGVVVNFIVFFDRAIRQQAATVENDVYNQVIYIK